MKKTNWKVNVNGRGLSATEIVDKIWNYRAINDVSEFLEPHDCNLISNSYMKNIDSAANVFIDGIENKKHFLIYADVDMDGCSSAAIIYQYLSQNDIEPALKINAGKEHGVSENFEIPDGTDVLVIVDSLNDQAEDYLKLWNSGIDIIVLDHHVISESILAIQDKIHLVSSANDYPNPNLSGSGVCWKFVNYIDSLRNTRYAEDLVDLAAIGIISDVCSVGPDSMENRYICSQGFHHICNNGIAALMNGEASLNSNLISFNIAPLVNAANRMGENELALKLFISSTAEATRIKKELTKIKDKQKTLVTELFEHLQDQVDSQKDNSCYYFIVHDTNKNLAGLIATKLSSSYHRPCVVLYEDENTYSGSMRAEGVNDLRSIINNSGFAECQGHENAAGITIPKHQFENLKLYVETALKNVSFTDQLTIDVCIDRLQITPFLIEKLKQVNEITGAGFPPVNVLIEDIRNYTVKQLSQGKHLSVSTADMKYIKWNFNDWNSVVEDGCLSVVGKLEESFFAGKKTIQLLIDDYIFQSIPKQTFLW